MKYRCKFCNYVYDEKSGEFDCGIAPGTPLEKTPYDFECPLCHTGKDAFIKISQNNYNT